MAAAEGATALAAGAVGLRDWLAVLPVLLPLCAAALLTVVRGSAPWHPPIALVTLSAVLVTTALLLRRVLVEGPFAFTMGGWPPPFGIAFTVDVLGATLATTASAVALACALAALHDIGETDRRYGFYPFLMLLMAGVGGAFLTGDIFNLYVWFEVFVIASFGLIILGSRRRQLDGALKYAILNLLGTTLFLIATAYLYGAFGTLNMADIARRAPMLAQTAPLATLSVLFLLAFGMKAAAFPVHAWLPASYHTPNMVTAALFAGLLTKVGVYALLRTILMLLPGAQAELGALIGWVAAATILVGALGALAQADIRRMLGFLVVSGVGVMLVGLALGGEQATAGTVLYAVHSMIATSALYLLVQLMGERGGGFSLHQLAGLWRRDPALSALALVHFLALIGLPPGSGVWPKAMLVEAALAQGSGWLAAAVLANGFLTTVALGRVFALAFWREAPQDHAEPTGPPLAPVAASAAALLALGLWPEPFIAVARSAAAGLIDPSAYVSAVFPGGAP